MLHAVPAQRDPVARADAFRKSVEDAMGLDGPEALARIMQLYSADMYALNARVEGLSAEASEAAAEKRSYFTMLQQVQTAASQKLWEAAQMAAELSTYRDMFSSVRRLADRSGGDPIPWEGIAASLAIEPAEPCRPSAVLAFIASDQFRGGQFVAEPGGDVTIVLTFIGWALVDHGPGAYGIIEPMFLVDNRALAKSAIEYERHVRLECFLPHLEREHAA